MGINRSSFNSVPLNQSTNVAIQMLADKPDVDIILETLVEPNILYGFYNGATDRVELYVTSASGNRYIRI